ncbi:MAG: cytochrome c maturation protein CcmE [Candidatus Zixiibacteriota bacterium]|nr:MAG: cytochrome c maturation protein CcmE [candidate division Zixibacteria bacterium]
MTKNIKMTIAIVVVVIAAIVGLSSLFTGGGMISYVSFSEARAAGGNVQVMGEISNSGALYDSETGTFIFYISNDTGDRMKVIYGGTKPGNFDQATSVVCVGKYRNDAFHAEKILVKCPSKYQDQTVDGSA